MVLQDEYGPSPGCPQEGPTLEGVDKGAGHCLGREAGGRNTLQNLGKCPEEDNDPKGGRRVVGRSARLVEDDTKRFL